MGAPSSLRRLARRPALPRRTVRLRLTGLYGGVFVASGAGLVAISYLLIENRLHHERLTTGGRLPSGPGPGAVTLPDSVSHRLHTQQSADLHQFLVQSLIALGVMALASILLGWLVAGRALHPVRTMTTRARRISERNLHERLGLAGPDDELKDLGDTIDGLLARLEAAFDSQRQFVANASHELRTPLMLERTLLQVALADAHLSLDSLRATCEELLQLGKQQEHLLEALLTLARSQRVLEHRQATDLARVTAQVLQDHQAAVAHKGLHLNSALDTAVLAGDARLLRVLVSNLFDNAVRHNVQAGRIEVEVTAPGGRPSLTISNTGRTIPAGQVERLCQPFQRLDGDRAGTHHGLGLGLTIAAAIVAAHDGSLVIEPRTGGGLSVEASFPAGA